MNVFNEKNIYDGVNIDFEYINKENADNLVSLIKELKMRLEKNYLLSVCVAPKTRVDQEGTLYEGHDYKQLGKYADFVILMTYEWGYTFGPAMPVAPLPNVRDVLIFAVTQIPSSKIFMGIPTYGYDFIEPFKKGRAAEAFPIDKAVDLAIKVKSSILFDDQSKTPYFIYYKEQQKQADRKSYCTIRKLCFLPTEDLRINICCQITRRKPNQRPKTQQRSGVKHRTEQ